MSLELLDVVGGSELPVLLELEAGGWLLCGKLLCDEPVPVELLVPVVSLVEPAFEPDVAPEVEPLIAPAPVFELPVELEALGGRVLCVELWLVLLEEPVVLEPWLALPVTSLELEPAPAEPTEPLEDAAAPVTSDCGIADEPELLQFDEISRTLLTFSVPPLLLPLLLAEAEADDPLLCVELVFWSLLPVTATVWPL